MYALGHRNEKEAKDYRKQNLMKEYGEYLTKVGVTIPKHQDVYEVCGGSIVLKDRFMRELCEEKGEGLIGNDLRKFSMVLQEEHKLKRVLKPFQTFPELKAPMWSKDDVKTVMKS